MTAQNLMQQSGVRPSVLRIKIYEYLRGTTSHPTVDDIFRALSDEFPTLSRTTVYNTVELFSRNGLIRALAGEGGCVRYDAGLWPHGHFTCRCCGGFYDIPLESVPECPAEGFLCESTELYFSGVCRECLENNEIEK